MNKKHLTGIFLMLTLLLTGCIKEDTEDCYSGLRLDFYFTLHTGNGNLFGEKVQRVHVYLFDEHKVLKAYAVDNGNKLEYSYLKDGEIKTVSTPNAWGALTNDYVMNLNQIPPGTYKIVTWAESNAKDNTTFFHGVMNDPATHDFKKGITLGTTTMADFRMFLKCKETTELPEDLVPEANEIDDLWYGAAGSRHPKTDMYTLEEVEVKNGSVSERHIELIRNTNILKTAITYAATTAEEANLRLWVVASDGQYDAYNNIGENARTIRYTPTQHSTNGQTILSDFKVIRLDMKRPVLLYIETPEGRRIPSKPINIVEKLLLARNPDTGEYIYQSQSDLDKIYEHPIEIRIDTHLEVRIFIGEWEIVDVKPAE